MGFDVGVVPFNPDGWGPPETPSGPPLLGGAVATASIPFAPFSRSDKLGRIADWTRNPGHPGAHAAASRDSIFDFTSADDSLAAAAEDSPFNPVKALPQRNRKKKPVSYSQLAQSIHELAATCDQKSSQRQLVNSVFPKLAVYNSVDPSVAPSLLMLHQQCEDKNVLRYVYYYLARILSNNGSQGSSAAGGIPTPNWDALADIDVVGGVTRADVVPRIVDQLSAESTSDDVEFHARRLAALKALTSASTSMF